MEPKMLLNTIMATAAIKPFKQMIFYQIVAKKSCWVAFPIMAIFWQLNFNKSQVENVFQKFIQTQFAI